MIDAGFYYDRCRILLRMFNLGRLFFLGILVVILTNVKPASAAQQNVQVFPIPEEHAAVYDEDRNGLADMTGDSWIFDQNNDGKADLIIRFRQEITLNAYLYDDVNGQGQVGYLVGTNGIQILEPQWRVKVTARDGSWALTDGKPDWNLDLLVDSGFALVSAPRAIPLIAGCQLVSGDPNAVELSNQAGSDKLGPSAIDGQVDFKVRYWDVNQDGIADYEWRNINTNGHYDQFISNTNPNLIYKISHRFPLLATVLQMDPSQPRLSYLFPLIPSQTNEAGFTLSFNRKIDPQGPNIALENPAAIYDLQGDNDCIPELRIRAVSSDVDPAHPDLVAYSEFRYTWSQTSDTPQFRLYLVGQAFNKGFFQYPPFLAAHVSYTQLPSFILGHAWRGASFAEAEKTTNPLDSISENTFFTPQLRKALLTPNQVTLPRYLPGYLSVREEYNFNNYDQTPRLYFDAVDRRIHLYKAHDGIMIFSADTANPVVGFNFNQQALTDGLLNISTSTVYSDSDNDGYIDRWIYQKSGRIVRQLVIRPGIALYTEGISLYIKQLPLNFIFSEWEAAPPSTPQEWKFFNERLATVQKTRHSLDDLGNMFKDLPGDLAVFPNTILNSISSRSDGLTALISTLGFSATTFPSFLSLPNQSISSGDYIIREQADKLILEYATPALLKISPLLITNPLPAPAGKPGILTFSVQNLSNTDVSGEVKVTDTDSARSMVLYKKEDIISAGSSSNYDLPWMPALSGSHHLAVQVIYQPQLGNPVELTQGLDWQTEKLDLSRNTLYQGDEYIGPTLLIVIFLVLFTVTGLRSLFDMRTPDDSEG